MFLLTMMHVRLPHARGGVSLQGAAHHIVFLVFPTLVGVFRVTVVSPGGISSLPHARGGVSQDTETTSNIERSSPRSWGCFWINPVSAEVNTESSPRSWGCFLRIKHPYLSSRVFPTLVGVFPTIGCLSRGVLRLPHARGGVSSAALPRCLPPSSSPRSWGCFYGDPHV